MINRIKVRDRLNKLSSKGRIDRKIYTKFRNDLTKQLRDAKATYFSQQFDKCKNNIKKTWQIINNTTKKRIKSNQTIIYEKMKIL